VIPQSVVLCVVAGAVVFIAAEGVQLALAVEALKTQGVTLHVPPLPDIALKPGPGGASPVKLPKDVDDTLARMHLVAGGAALVALALVALTVKG